MQKVKIGRVYDTKKFEASMNGWLKAHPECRIDGVHSISAGTGTAPHVMIVYDGPEKELYGSGKVNEDENV